MVSRAIGRRIAGISCGAALLLAGCSTSAGTAPTPSETYSTTGTSTATTTIGSDNGASTPEASPGDTRVPAPESPLAVPGDSAPEAAPAPESPAATPGDSASEGIWDPCSLPDEDLARARLATDTEERIPDDRFPTWRMCKWKAIDRTFELVINASDSTVDEVLEPGKYHDLRKTTFQGRELTMYRAVADTHRLACHIVTPADFGSIVFAVRNTRIQTDAGDPCDEANLVGLALFPSLP